MSSPENFPYIHGFSEEEQQRLRHQARFNEFAIYRNIDFSRAKHIIEVGCGVGAQTEILLRRYPDLKITGIDLNQKQLASAQQYLSSLPLAESRFDIKEMNAMDMSFSGESFDGAFLCWVLEHVPDPLQVLNEVRRVLKPGAKVFITEVMNSTFFLDPYSPNVWKYWMAFNDFQFDNAGDPFVGSKLGNFLNSTGYSNIKTHIVNWHLDNRHPVQRREMMDYWLRIMLSASEALKSDGYLDQETIDAAVAEMNKVKTDPNGVFLYSFMQAEATVY